MKYLYLIGSSFLIPFTIAQDSLRFVDLGTELAFCRTSSEQNGNGVVYCAATGGTPDYTYLWTEMSTGETSIGTTWGGRNAGYYEIEITDAEGTSIRNQIYLDSINPIAKIIVEGDVEGGPVYYTGSAPLSIRFENFSEHVNDTGFDDGFIRYFFQPQVFEAVETYSTNTESFDYTYNYDGDWKAILVAKNRNGCTDTTFKWFTINGPLSTYKDDVASNISVYTTPNTIQINSFSDNQNQLLFRLYTVDGKLTKEVELADETTIINQLESQQIYIYEIIDTKLNVVLKSDKCWLK